MTDAGAPPYGRRNGSAPHASRLSEFGWLLVGEGASVLGDQLAKVAVAVLVFGRTGSAALAALTYALTLLPDLIAGPLLSPLADRYPRRAVMIACALVQAVLAAIMAIPGLPLGIVALAVIGITAGQAPYKAAQSATLPAMVAAVRVEGAQARLSVIREGGQLVGLAGAGAVVGTVGSTWAILADAVSFLVVAVVLRIGVRPRPAATTTSTKGAPRRAAIRLIRRSAQLRLMTWLRLLSALTILPDAVVVPLVGQLGSPTWVIGPMLAADCVGFIIGAAWVDRMPAERKRAAMVPLAIVSLGALAPFVLLVARVGTHWLVAVIAGVLLVVSGVGAAFLPLTTGLISKVAPDHIRGAVMGLERTVLRAGQGLGAVLAGVFAQWLGSAALVIGIGGFIGVAGTLLAALRGRAYGTAPATAGLSASSISVAEHDATSLPGDADRKGVWHGSVTPRQGQGQPSPTTTGEIN
ncbi:MAG TPA: MFS transporter [Pseudonocardiaceae bacterium]